MHNQSVLISFLLSMAPLGAMAQEAELTISAGRPGMATGTDICPTGKLQWETGVGVERNNRNWADETTWTTNTSAFRFGISPHAEFSLQVDALSAKCGDDKVRGVAPLVLSTKIKMMEAHSWLPEMSFLGSLTLPTGKSEFRPANAAPAMYLLFHHDLSDALGLDYNVGAEWDGWSSNVTTFAAACLGLSLTDSWGVFVESYNYFARGEKADCYADFGVTFLPHRRIQLDLSANVNFNDFGNYLGVGFGVAWLIN